jgi:hypothetical protein
MSTLKFKCPLLFQKSVQPAINISQFDAANTLQLHFLKTHLDILHSLLRFGTQNALLSSSVPNENGVGQCLCRLSLTYYILRPSQTRWWAILVAGIFALTLYVCAAVCFSRCQLLGIKSFHWTQHAFRPEDGNRSSERNVVFCRAY